MCPHSISQHKLCKKENESTATKVLIATGLYVHISVIRKIVTTNLANPVALQMHM